MAMTTSAVVLGGMSNAKTVNAPCPSGESHLRSRCRVCDDGRGIVLIPPRGSAQVIIPLSPREETDAGRADRRRGAHHGVPGVTEQDRTILLKTLEHEAAG